VAFLYDTVMGYGCVAHNCLNHTENKDAARVVHFHQFPFENADLTRKWVIATKIDGLIAKKSHRLCSDHFTRDDYIFSNSTRLKPNAVPSVFSFPPHLLKKPMKKRKNPCEHYHQLQNDNELQKGKEGNVPPEKK